MADDDVTTIGTLLISEALPEDLRKKQYRLDKKGIHKLFMEVAERYPDQYKEILQRLSKVGATTAWAEGLSVSLADLYRSRAKERVLAPVRQKIQAVIDDDDLDDQARKDAIIDTLIGVAGPLQDAVLEESRQRGSGFAVQVDSGARGNKGSLASLKGADLLATDQSDQFIPVPILHSYAEGLTPAEYFAASYGQRKGQIDVKMATSDAGFLCFDGDTQVRMADYSVKRIRDIEAGEWVMGADMQGRMFPVEVLEVFENGCKATVEYQFRSGCNRQLLSVIATPQHEMLAVRKLGSSRQSINTPTKIPLAKAWQGYGVVSAKGLSSECHDTGEDVGWMALAVGLLLGDGCLSGNSTTFACADEALIRELNNRWNPHNHFVKKIHRQREHVEWIIQEITPSAYATDGDGRVVRGARDPFRRLLSDLDVLGRLAVEKEIPKQVWSWNQRSVADFIAGLLETDGCATHTNNGTAPIFRFSVVSEVMVRQLKELLEVRFGIYTTEPAQYGADNVGVVKLREINGQTLRVRQNYPIWTIAVSQRESLERLLRIPMPGLKGARFRELMAAALPPTRDERHVFSFVSKAEAGFREVWDIAVDHPDHLYVLANGMVVSNSKQLVNAAHRQVVTREQPTPRRLSIGLPVEVNDKANIGAVLATDIGGLKTGTVLTDEHLQQLQDQDVDEILVFSPMTEASEDGGISAWAAGRRTRNGLHQVGDNIGIPAAQSIGERLSQGALSSKHSAGVGTKISKSGFEYLNRLIQAPEQFPEAGPLAEADGVVEDIRKAPQGGHYIKVGGKDYYAGEALTPVVKVGDRLEQGDDLTDGVPHPNALVRLRGMGEARRVYMRELREALENSGVKAHRRNVESVVAGLLNWAEVTDPDGIGDNIYSDVVPYGYLTANYKPRRDAQQVKPQQAIGTYLEEPVLHYTPGTRVTRKVADRLKKWKVDNIFTHPEPPGFEPHMVRGLLAVYNDPDWKTRLSGFYTARAFERSLHRGLESDIKSTSYVPAIGNPQTLGQGLATQGKYGASGSSPRNR